MDESITPIDWDLVRNEQSEDTNWERYLGKKDDPISYIRIRFPNGRLVMKEFPCSSQFLVSSKSKVIKREVVTPFRNCPFLDTSIVKKNRIYKGSL